METRSAKASDGGERVIWIRHRPHFVLRAMLVGVALLFAGVPILIVVAPGAKFSSALEGFVAGGLFTVVPLALAAFCLQPVLFRGEIRLDAASRDLVFTYAGLSRWRERFSTADAAALVLCRRQGVFGKSMHLALQRRDGSTVLLSLVGESEAEDAGRAISAATSLPVTYG